MRLKLWLSGVLVIALAAFLVVLAACAAEATPTPTPRPPTPTSTPRPPTPTPTPLPPGVTPTPRPPTPTPVPKTPEQVRYEEAMEEFKLVEAAGKKEGSVAFLTSTWGDRPWPQDAFDLFAKRYPEIKVEQLLSGYTAALERTRAETATKRVHDLLYTGASIGWTLASEGKHFINYTPPVILDPSIPLWFDPHIEGPDSPILVSADSVSYPVINTKLVPNEADWPKCFKDMVDPKWRNKIALQDPSLPGFTLHHIHGLLQLYGEGWVRQLFENSVVFTEGADRAVVLGDYPLLFSGTTGTRDTYPEAPIKLLVMCEGTANAWMPLWQVYKDARHTNAAKVLVNFMFDKPAMEVIGKRFFPYRLDVIGDPLLDPIKVGTLADLPIRSKVFWEVTPKERAWSASVLKELGKK